MSNTADWTLLGADRRLTAGKIGAVTAGATASATGGNTLTALLFNETPTFGYARSGQTSNGVVTGKLTGVDAEGDPLTYTITTQPANGTVTLSADGNYNYTPSDAFAYDGITDQFSVTVSDAGAGFHIHGIGGLLNLLTFGLLGTAGHTSTWPVPVTAYAWKRYPPTATATVGAPDPTTGIVAGQVVGRAADDSPVTYSAPPATSKGSITLNAETGAFAYNPTAAARDAAKAGVNAGDKADSFTVTVTDTYGGATEISVNVAISPTPNRAPVAGTPSVGAPNPATGVVTGSVNATDADGDTLTFKGATTTTTKGSVTVTANGTFTYTPTATARHAAAKIGATSSTTTDSFTVIVSDGKGATANIPVTVTISPLNATPVAGTPTVGTPNSSTGAVTGTVRATDANGDTLTYTAPATTGKGSVSINSSTGAFTYTPTLSARQNAAKTGATTADKTDTFTVTITDGYGGTTSSTVTTTIKPTPTPYSITGTVSVGSGPYALAVSYDDTRVYVANNAGDSVTVFYTATNTVKTTINLPSGSRPYGIQAAYNGRDIYVATLLSGNQVWVIDTQFDASSGSIGFQQLASAGQAFSPDGKITYVAGYNGLRDSVSVIDRATNQVKNVINLPTGSRVSGVALNGDGTVLYVANLGTNTVSVVYVGS